MSFYQDKELFALINDELYREQNTIELIASENIVSEAVLAAAGSVLTNKYAEGYPNARYYGGCEVADKVEQLAIERAKKLFHCNFANVQPHSGSQANYAAYAAIARPGDTILSLHLNDGGHLTHGSKVNFSGKLYNFEHYSLNKRGFIDYKELGVLVYKTKPKAIMVGASAYPRRIDFRQIHDIAKEFGASDSRIVVDMAHIAGLVAAGLHQSPLPYADIITSTTHKTLRGPRGGMILTNDEAIAKKIDKAIFPGSQGGPLMHIIAAKAVAFGEALQPEFVEYQKQILKNIKAMEKVFRENCVKMVSDGSDNHMLILDLRNTRWTGSELQIKLESVGIATNKNMIPGDIRSPRETSGLRLGTAAVTTRGMKAPECSLIADIIAGIINGEINDEKAKLVVKSLCDKFPIYNNKFDFFKNF